MAGGSVRNIVVTGASRGLGHALVGEFARLGHRVAACARSSSGRDAAWAGLLGTVDVEAVDVCDDAAVGRWARRVLSEVGVPDLVVNNAGRINRNAPLWEVGPDEFAAVVDTNVKGTHSVLRHFAPTMIAAGRGVFANFSSGWGRSTSPEVAPYCASKWAIEGLSAAFAQELPSGLACVAVNPGIIDTEMLRSCFGGASSSSPSATAWAPGAARYLLELGPRDSGRPGTIPAP